MGAVFQYVTVLTAQEIIEASTSIAALLPRRVCCPSDSVHFSFQHLHYYPPVPLSSWITCLLLHSRLISIRAILLGSVICSLKTYEVCKHLGEGGKAVGRQLLAMDADCLLDWYGICPLIRY